MAYGIIVPQEFLDIPRLGCVNLHVSLLPSWRGAAPVPRAILAGDTKTGITMMQMDAGLDTGNILVQYTMPITKTATSYDLERELCVLGANNLCSLLTDLDAGDIISVAQDNAAASYAKKMTKAEAEINWHTDAEYIERMVRAFNAWPVAFTKYNDTLIRIWQASVENISHQHLPGEIVTINKHGIDVAASDSIIRIIRLQFPGKKQMSVADMLNGSKELLSVGNILG